MCGIAGILAAPGALEAPEARLLDRMLAALDHRGPDGRGQLASGRARIGAARLAIRARSDGLQPVVDAASGVVAVCNGEIDNHAELRRWLASRGHRVPSAVDVAVLPGLWLELGPELVSRLEGPFALAVWDPRDERLLLARDRAGEKPLFYSARHGAIRFASELAALVRDEPDLLAPDESALAAYLERGWFSAPDTPFSDVRKVGPGELVVLDRHGVSRRRWWRLDLPLARKRPPDVEAFDTILCRAVERATDVEADYGIFLSGGLDSSLLAALVRRVRPLHRPLAFAVRFGEPSYDEGDAASRVARRLGLELVPVWLRADEVPGLLRDLVTRCGEPLADPAWLPLAQLSRRAACDVRMALGGEGADELFGGYPTYLGAGLADGFARLPAALRAGVRRVVAALPQSERKVTIPFLLRRFVAAAELGGLERHRVWQSSLAPDLLARLDAKTLRSFVAEPPRQLLLDVVQQYDLEHSLAEALLTKADRGGMRSGLELRAPFLDSGVMAFAASLPQHERVRGLRTKVFLKRYARRHLPGDVVRQRKRGLSVPLAGWLRGPLRPWAEALLQQDRLERVGIRDRDALGLLDEHGRGDADHGRALWTLLVLAEWLDWREREERTALRPEAA